MNKTLALKMAFSEEDIHLAFGLLGKANAIPEGITAGYFTEGEPIEVVMDEIDKEQSLEMCMGLMGAIIFGKEKQKEDAKNSL